MHRARREASEPIGDRMATRLYSDDFRMILRDDTAGSDDCPSPEQRLKRARAAMDAEVAALAHERAVRLAPLQRELDAASSALARAPGKQPPVSFASRGDSHVWTVVARRLGASEFGVTDIVEIAQSLRHTDIEQNVALRKIWSWLRREHIERIAVGTYRFVAAGRTHYRIDTADPTPDLAPRPRTPLTLAAAMSGPSSRRRRIPTSKRRHRPPEPT